MSSGEFASSRACGKGVNNYNWNNVQEIEWGGVVKYEGGSLVHAALKADPENQELVGTAAKDANM